MISVRELTKVYGNTLAVNRVSFEVEKGKIVGFLGPNGAGKTTTMRVLTCFLPPTSGKVQIAGFDVVEKPNEVKKRIGYLPETPPLYPEMTVADYLTFVAKLKNIPSAEVASAVSRARISGEPRGVGSPLVRSRMPTDHPWPISRTIVPPMPSSASSGCGAMTR